MPQGVEVQVLSSALLPGRLMVGHQSLKLVIVVRIHAGQHFFKIGVFVNGAERWSKNWVWNGTEFGKEYGRVITFVYCLEFNYLE